MSSEVVAVCCHIHSLGTMPREVVMVQIMTARGELSTLRALTISLVVGSFLSFLLVLLSLTYLCFYGLVF